MGKRLVYLVGEPGAGKSTVLAAALEGWERVPQRKPLAHDLLHRDGLVEAVELGVCRPGFPGTDALAMNAIVAAERLLVSPPAPVVIGEGARLGCGRFLGEAVRLGFAVTLVHVVSPDAAANRAGRAARLGVAPQKDSWVRAQATKARNLAALAPVGVRVVVLDTSVAGAVRVLREDVLALPAVRVRGCAA